MIALRNFLVSDIPTKFLPVDSKKTFFKLQLILIFVFNLGNPYGYAQRAIQKKPVPISRNAVISVALCNKCSHDYSLYLKKGECAKLLLVEKGSKIGFVTENPNHQVIEDIDIPLGTTGMQYPIIPANKDGNYLIRVKSIDSTVTGAYAIKVLQVLSPDQYKLALKKKEAYGLRASRYISIDSLTKNIQMLSSDSFQGRFPGTPGESRTIDYLQSQFRRIGLEAGNGNSYFQTVELKPTYTSTDISELTISGEKEKLVLKEKEDFSLWGHYPDENISLQNAEIVFAGYGIVSEKYHRDDYKGLDVKGKIALILRDPRGKFDDSLKYRTYKTAEAAKHGAIGCLYIFDSTREDYPFIDTYFYSKQEIPVSKMDSSKSQHMMIEGFVRLESAKKIMAFAGFDTAIFSKADQSDFRGINLPVKFSVNIRGRIKPVAFSHNVIGKITGTKYPGEYVLFTAHWDHLGIGKPNEKGDSIYNGALDNAAGTSGLVEVARAFKMLPQNPERTVLFMAVTSEEEGLLGSLHYVSHPIYPLDNTVADINLDGLNTMGESKDMSVYGPPLSTLDDMIESEAARAGKYFGFDSAQNLYQRSDQYSFANAGIPAIFIGGGFLTSNKRGAELDSLYSRFNSTYHQPSDEFDPAIWDLRGSIIDLFIVVGVGEQLANSQIWPQWKKNAPFKKLQRKK